MRFVFLFSREKMAPANLERYIRSIFVQNIPAVVTEDAFRQILSRLGTLLHFHMFVDPTTSSNPLDKIGQTSRSFAFVEVKLTSKNSSKRSIFFVFSLLQSKRLKRLLVN